MIELGFNVDDKQQGKAQIINFYLYLGINALKNDMKKLCSMLL